MVFCVMGLSKIYEIRFWHDVKMLIWQKPWAEMLIITTLKIAQLKIWRKDLKKQLIFNMEFRGLGFINYNKI